jgi:hypothetical protein
VECLVYGQQLAHGTPFLLTLDAVMVLAGQFVALQNSRVIVSLDVWRVSQTTFFNVQRPLSVIKRGLKGRGFVVVVPSRFHYTIMSPAADLGNLRRVAMSLTGFLLL